MAQSFTTTPALGVAGPAGVVRVPDGTVRWVILAHARDLLRQARARWITETVPADGEYRQLHGAVLAEALTLDESHEELTALCERLADDFPDRCGPVADAVRGLAVVLEPAASVAELWTAHSALLTALDAGGDDSGDCTVTPLDGALEIRLGGAGPGAAGQLDTAAFLARLRRLTGAARQDERRPSAAHLVAERFAFDALSRGSGSARHWGTPGFRDHQTYMAVTDPGEGHIDGTVRSLAHLDGVIVHLEHLERGGDQDSKRVEPYRIPDPQMIRQVRLVVGDDAPVSSYVGRPVFEGAVEQSMLKTARTVAAVCSALFAQGLAECKITIQGMTARQAVRFMRAVRAGVSRDRFTQVLAATFNINTPLLDDRAGHLFDGRLVTERLDIGLLGVELARAGGFDKVAWDGTGDTYPSRCVLEQLSYVEAVTLVHRAHERGLLTYFSAGFRLHDLAQAVMTGVDGVGVGGAQILRYMDAETGFHGPFQYQRIPAILAERDLAETSVLGQAARALSRLDRMAFEGTITAWDNVHRQDLFTALSASRYDIGELRRLLGAVTHVTELPEDAERPLLGWANRLLAGRHHTLAAGRTQRRADWQAHLDRVTQARDSGDLDRLELLLVADGRFAAASLRRRDRAADQALAA